LRPEDYSLRPEDAVNRWISALVWLSFTAVMYLIFVELIWPWFHLPDLGNIGFTLVFVLFSVAHCCALEGLKRTSIFFAISAIISHLMEEIGVRTGLIFGAYHYSDLLGPKLGHVPAIIPLAWFMMVYPAWAVARVLVQGIDTSAAPGLTARAIIAAMVITAWDAVMDPGMAAAGNWVWERGGLYFGVPRRNYFGWLLTTFVIYWIVGWLWRGLKHRTAATRGFEALPVVVYSFFALRYVTTNRIPALQVVALFSMGLPALLALIRVFLGSRTAAGVSEPDRLIA
jgi:uncharacterized membrane protein